VAAVLVLASEVQLHLALGWRLCPAGYLRTDHLIPLVPPKDDCDTGACCLFGSIADSPAAAEWGRE
jgi:hypothetical protein